MFDNAGGKIKSIVRTMFFIEAVAAVISGIALMGTDDDLILPGLLVMVVGPFAVWVVSLFLYGFGQLVENSDAIAAEYNRKNEKHEKTIAKTNEKKQEEKKQQRKKQFQAAMQDSNVSDDTFIDITCTNCKSELSYTKEQLQSGEKLTCPVCDAPISLL